MGQEIEIEGIEFLRLKRGTSKTLIQGYTVHCTFSCKGKIQEEENEENTV